MLRFNSDSELSDSSSEEEDNATLQSSTIFDTDICDISTKSLQFQLNAMPTAQLCELAAAAGVDEKEITVASSGSHDKLIHLILAATQEVHPTVKSEIVL